MKNRLILIISLLVCLALLSSCSIVDKLIPTVDTDEIFGEFQDDTSSSQTEAETEGKEETFSLTVYTDPSSDEFSALGEDVTVLEGCYDAGENDIIRFVCSEDGVDLLLEAVSYYPALNYFYPYMPVFNTSSNAGTVYEFACPFADSIPSYRLSAEKDGVRLEWYPVCDGENNNSVITLQSEEKELTPPTENDAIISLCKVYASNSVKSGQEVASLPDLFWNTVAESVCLLEENANGSTPEGEIRVEEWVIDEIASALFPSENYPGISDWDSIEYTEEYNERYIVSSDFESIAESVHFISSEVVGYDTAEVVLEVTTEHSPAEAHITLEKTTDTEDPFGWTILSFEFFTD